MRSYTVFYRGVQVCVGYVMAESGRGRGGLLSRGGSDKVNEHEQQEWIRSRLRWLQVRWEHGQISWRKMQTFYGWICKEFSDEQQGRGASAERGRP
jgi:hypothetical protein